MPEKFVVDNGSIRELARLLEETGLTEIEYQIGTQRVRLVKSSAQNGPIYSTTSVPSYAPPPASKEEAVTAAPAAQGEIIPSPMVGTVYLAGEPGATPLVKVGDMVKKGDTLLIVEAMKVMNPIRAPRDGQILEVCVQDAKPVEFGEPLIVLV